ncbi:unnamed protein product [Gongylonema pulchrum]|uniref:Uncharacterized protein n=1 Tax=Gongylonema pulchrum TaxID=637853 RepID=A0A183CXA0_9BILA|nr:unnamed protein product [Gongylonema pulchrum]
MEKLKSAAESHTYSNSAFSKAINDPSSGTGHHHSTTSGSTDLLSKRMKGQEQTETWGQFIDLSNTALLPVITASLPMQT